MRGAFIVNVCSYEGREHTLRNVVLRDLRTAMDAVRLALPSELRDNFSRRPVIARCLEGREKFLRLNMVVGGQRLPCTVACTECFGHWSPVGAWTVNIEPCEVRP
jgi:hypothetical protein